jgi:hypothetical protein
MTLSDTEFALFSFFAKNETFVMEDFDKVITISIDRERDMAVVLAALENLEKQELIKKLTNGKKTWWVLTKPFASYSQKVELTAGTIYFLADFINGICESTKDEKNKVDPLSIKEKDIQNLLLIAASNNKEKEI